MDPISMLVAALVSGATEALKPTVGQAIKDAYSGLKGIISKKLAGQPAGEDVQAAIKSVEKKPADPARKSVLTDEVKSTGIAADPDVVAEIQKLVEALQQAGLGAGISASNGGVVNTGNVGGSIVTGQVDTGDGPFIGGDVSAGGDFVGRDRG